MAETNRQDIINVLVRLLADRQIDPSHALPAIKALVGETLPPATLADLDRLVSQSDDPALDSLRPVLRQARLGEVMRHHHLRKRNEPIPESLRNALAGLPLEAPLGWETRDASIQAFARALTLARDRRFAASRQDRLPGMASAVEKALAETSEATIQTPSIWGLLPPLMIISVLEHRADIGNALKARLARLREKITAFESEQSSLASAALKTYPSPLPAGLDERLFLEALADRVRETDSGDERRRLLDIAACWPTDESVGILDELAVSAWAQERLTLIMGLRFGEPQLKDWSKWRTFIANYRSILNERLRSLKDPLQSRPEDLLQIWCRAHGEMDPDMFEILDAMARQADPAMDTDNFVVRWSETLTAEEANLLASRGPPPLPAAESSPKAACPVTPPPLPAVTPLRLTRTETPPVRPPASRPAASHEERVAEPAGPQWLPQLQSFLVENWYLAVGLLMILLGCSVLAYYTWDKHWLVRHTLLPGLLVAVTLALAGSARRLEKSVLRLVGTATLLRGAAIALLPANFITISFLVADPLVPFKAGFMTAVSLAYVLGFGWGLSAWCRAVHPPASRLLTVSLLFLNLLVLARPVGTLLDLGDAWAHPLLEGSFYAGFCLAAVALLRFARPGLLTETVVTERRIPWFFCGTILATFFQVVAWVYGSAHIVPRGFVYAPMVVLAGGVLLRLEQRFLQIQGTPREFGKESFLGFAAILVGILMSLDHPILRSAVLLLSGAVWLAHAWGKRHPLHYGVGLILVSAAGASLCFWLGFLREAQPAVALAMAAVMEAFVILGRRSGLAGLSGSAGALQTAWLVFAVASAIWEPWICHIPSAPAAAYVGIASMGFAYTAFRDQSSQRLHLAAFLLALPASCMGPAWTWASMPLTTGLLACLWIGLVTGVRHPLLLSARSSVVIVYGLLTLATVAYRMAASETPLHLASAATRAAVIFGPALATVALVQATRFSSSLLPGFTAAILALLSISEVAGVFGNSLPALRPGSGLGSAGAALVLMALAFVIRRRIIAPADTPDPFFGAPAFPFVRRDHSLFTTPLVFVALFLCLRVENWTLWKNLLGDIFDWRTAAAAGITGVVWLMAGIYERERKPWAVLAMHVGWIWWFLSLFIHASFRASELVWSGPALATAIILQALYFACLPLGKRLPWVPDILAGPFREVLARTAPLLTAGTLLSLMLGKPMDGLLVLMAFLAAQHIWHALRTGRLSYGSWLFALLWSGILAWSNTSHTLAASEVSLFSSLGATLGLLLGIHLAAVLVEAIGRDRTFRPLLLPLLVSAGVLAGLIALLAMDDALGPLAFSRVQQIALLAALLLAARALHSGAMALLAILLGYVMLHVGLFGPETDAAGRLARLWSPWKIALLALGMSGAAAAGIWVHRRRPRLLSGAFATGILHGPAAPCLCAAAILAASLAFAAQMADPGLRLAHDQLATPFVAGLTLVLSAWFWRLRIITTLGVLMILAGNVAVVHAVPGPWLQTYGLTDIHLTNLGLAAGLLESFLVQFLLPYERVTSYLSRLSLAVAGAILALIMIIYLANPDLGSIPISRLAVSGAIAYLAGWAFRRFSRRQAVGLPAHWTEPVYHFGVTLALWCAALMWTPLRTPNAALWALALPLFYFWLRAELNRIRPAARGEAYRTSAATLGFVFLALYMFLAPFQWVLFPSVPVTMDHYHTNSPLIMLEALLLLRLRGLGATPWLVFYAGAAMIVGSFFALTAIPRFRPLDHPMAAAWCAIALSHFWTLVSYQRSPLRTLILDLSGMDVREWLSHRHAWGVFILLASHVAVGWGAMEALLAAPARLAPLCLGLASVFMHMGWIRDSRGYFVLGWLEIALALHMGFFVESLIPADQVVWIVLGIWAAAIVAHASSIPRLRQSSVTALCAASALLALAHVCGQHGPESDTGLVVMALIGILGLCTPVGSETPETASGRLAAAAVIWIPTWVTFFSQVAGARQPGSAPWDAWPWLTCLLAFLATGSAAGFLARNILPNRGFRNPLQPRLVHRTMGWLESSGEAVQRFTCILGIAILTPLGILQSPLAFDLRESLLLAALWVFSSAGWFLDGWKKNSPRGTLAGVWCAVGAAVALRGCAMRLTSGAWLVDYDIWISLALSAGFTIARQWVHPRRPGMAPAFSAAVLVIPAVTLGWILLQHLDTDTAVLVLSVHSMLWIWLGKDDSQSPFHGLAVGGFVTVILMLFWTHLGLRILHAYVMPVGLGTLVLLHLYGNRVQAEARNGIRTAVLLAMLGSIGYQLLISGRLPVLYHLTLIVSGLAAMGLGALLKVRVYLLLGTAAVLVDLCAIGYAAFAQIDRGLKMTLLGTAVLLMGGGLVIGAIYVKTHREAIRQRMFAWKNLLGRWE